MQWKEAVSHWIQSRVASPYLLNLSSPRNPLTWGAFDVGSSLLFVFHVENRMILHLLHVLTAKYTFQLIDSQIELLRYSGVLCYIHCALSIKFI